MLEHGQIEVKLQDDIIMCKLIGSFNQDGVKRYAAAVKSAIEQLNGKPFAMVIDDLMLEGGTPEAFQALQEYNVWLNEQPLIAKAFVIDKPMLKDIILKRSPALLDQKIDFFKNVEDAIAWLQPLIKSN